MVGEEAIGGPLLRSALLVACLVYPEADVQSVASLQLWRPIRSISHESIFTSSICYKQIVPVRITRNYSTLNCGESNVFQQTLAAAVQVRAYIYILTVYMRMCM